MGRNENFNRGRGRRPINADAVDAVRNGDKPKQGQDPDQGYAITVYPQNECEHCGVKYFLPEHLQRHIDVKHPPKFL
jgi:hypothetical protein